MADFSSAQAFFDSAVKADPRTFERMVKDVFDKYKQKVNALEDVSLLQFMGLSQEEQQTIKNQFVKDMMNVSDQMKQMNPFKTFFDTDSQKSGMKIIDEKMEIDTNSNVNAIPNVPTKDLVQKIEITGLPEPPEIQTPEGSVFEKVKEVEIKNFGTEAEKDLKRYAGVPDTEEEMISDKVKRTSSLFDTIIDTLSLSALAALSWYKGLQEDGPFKGAFKLAGNLFFSVASEGISLITDSLKLAFQDISTYFKTGFIGSIIAKASSLSDDLLKGVSGLFTRLGSSLLEVSTKAAPDVTEYITKNVPKFITSLFGALTSTTSFFVKPIMGVLKMAGSLLLNTLRFVPFIGSFIDFGFAADRFMKGDITGGLIDLGAGILGLVTGGAATPIIRGIGFALSFLNAGRDLTGASDIKEGQYGVLDLMSDMWGSITSFGPIADLINFGETLIGFTTGSNTLADVFKAIPMVGYIGNVFEIFSSSSPNITETGPTVSPTQFWNMSLEWIQQSVLGPLWSFGQSLTIAASGSVEALQETLSWANMGWMVDWATTTDEVSQQPTTTTTPTGSVQQTFIETAKEGRLKGLIEAKNALESQDSNSVLSYFNLGWMMDWAQSSDTPTTTGITANQQRINEDLKNANSVIGEKIVGSIESNLKEEFSIFDNVSNFIPSFDFTNVSNALSDGLTGIKSGMVLLSKNVVDTFKIQNFMPSMGILFSSFEEVFENLGDKISKLFNEEILLNSIRFEPVDLKLDLSKQNPNVNVDLIVPMERDQLKQKDIVDPLKELTTAAKDIVKEMKGLRNDLPKINGDTTIVGQAMRTVSETMKNVERNIGKIGDRIDKSLSQAIALQPAFPNAAPDYPILERDPNDQFRRKARDEYRYAERNP